MGMDKLWESKQKLKRINASDSGKPFPSEQNTSLRNPRGRFEDRNTRVTTYLENDLFREIASLREQGKIRNLKVLYNNALRDYLRKNDFDDQSEC